MMNPRPAATPQSGAVGPLFQEAEMLTKGTAIQEYDRELGEKEAAYRTELTEYKEVQRTLTEFEASIDSVKQAIERLDALKAAQLEARDLATKQIEEKQHLAAGTIQRVWRMSRDRKQAEVAAAK